MEHRAHIGKIFDFKITYLYRLCRLSLVFINSVDDHEFCLIDINLKSIFSAYFFCFL